MPAGTDNRRKKLPRLRKRERSMGKDVASRHYEGEAGRRYHEEKRAIPEAAYPWVERLRAAKLAPELQQSDNVLEFGVGFGWNLAQLDCQRKLGHDVTDFLGISLRDHGIEFVRETSTLVDASIDAVVCHHTLEHTLNPVAVLHEIRRLLRS